MAGLSYLADFCALVFYHGRGGLGMTGAGRRVMEEADVFVSPITVWEITRKAGLRKLATPVPKDYTGGFASWLSDAGYRTLPLSWDDCERAAGLPGLHKDPMDRMLIASVLMNDRIIVTNDRMIARYREPAVW